MQLPSGQKWRPTILIYTFLDLDDYYVFSQIEKWIYFFEKQLFLHLRPWVSCHFGEFLTHVQGADEPLIKKSGLLYITFGTLDIINIAFLQSHKGKKQIMICLPFLPITVMQIAFLHLTNKNNKN